MPLILASASTARRAMLEAAGINFQCHPADIDEQLIKDHAQARQTSAAEIALLLAKAKARTIAQRYPSDLVVGSDQILEIEGDLLSKVRSREEAAVQLIQLQGRTHCLHSAVACFRDSEPLFLNVSTVKLAMRPLSANDIDHYLDAAGSTVLGSVGCYQIEGLGIRLFDAIDGDHFTIMGMPLLPLLKYLRSCDAAGLDW